MKSASKMRRISDNPVTGNPRIQGPGKLISINPVAFPLKNQRGTLAHVATLEVVNDNGEVEATTGIVYKTNLDQYGALIGQNVLVTMEKTPGFDTLLTTVAPHLAAGQRAQTSAFSGAFAGPIATPTPSEIRNANDAGEDLTIDGQPIQELESEMETFTPRGNQRR